MKLTYDYGIAKLDAKLEWTEFSRDQDIFADSLLVPVVKIISIVNLTLSAKTFELGGSKCTSWLLNGPEVSEKHIKQICSLFP